MSYRTIPAIPTAYNGTTYASRLEFRVARLLTERKIAFEYDKRFHTNSNTAGYRSVDFWLPEPILICWSDFYVSGLEAKGVLDVRSYLQRQALREVGVQTFIITDAVCTFYERYAFLKSEFRSKYGRSLVIPRDLA